MNKHLLSFLDNLFKRFFKFLKNCGITCCCCNSQCVIDKSTNCPEQAEQLEEEERDLRELRKINMFDDDIDDSKID